MEFIEFGKENSDVVMLLHGGGLSWWNYRDEAELLRDGFHVVLPIIDGHAGSDRSFTSIGDCADELIGFIDERFGGRVSFIGGLSLGGQILTEALARRGDICGSAIIESALVVPSRLTKAMIRPAFGSCYGLIKKEWFARLQAGSLGIRPELFDDYFRDTKAIEKEDMIAFLEANSIYSPGEGLRKTSARVEILAGTKETKSIRRSAEILHGMIPESRLELLDGMRHGELSLDRAGEYVERLRGLISEAKS